MTKRNWGDVGMYTLHEDIEKFPEPIRGILVRAYGIDGIDDTLVPSEMLHEVSQLPDDIRLIAYDALAMVVNDNKNGLVKLFEQEF